MNRKAFKNTSANGSRTQAQRAAKLDICPGLYVMYSQAVQIVRLVESTVDRYSVYADAVAGIRH